MLEINNLIEINKIFSNGEIDKIDELNYTILKINNSNNWIDQIAFLLKALESDNCFKYGNRETAAACLLASMECNKIPINQDNVLKILFTISKNHIVDIRRIKRIIKELI